MALGYGRTGTNNFACAKFIVDTNGISAGATHSTIASAITSASAGDTIIIKEGTYPENLTVSKKLSFVAYGTPSRVGNVTVTGKWTVSADCLFYGLILGNSGDITISTSAGITRVDSCKMNSNASGALDCSGGEIRTFNISCDGGKLLNQSGGSVRLFNAFVNAASAASTVSAGTLIIEGSDSISPITTSGTAILSMFNCRQTAVIIAGGSGAHTIHNSSISTGSSTSITVTDNLTITNSDINSTHATAAIDGAGTISHAGLTFSGSADEITTTTKTVLVEGPSRTIGGNNIGASNALTVTNTDNTSTASHAAIKIATGGASGGDPYFRVGIDGVREYSFGVDNDDSDAFVLTDAGSLNGSNFLKVTTAGEITQPLQPSFNGYVNGDILNVTGDGTVYTIIFNAELHDQNADFNTTTGTFVAPVAGKYYLNVNIGLSGLTASFTTCTVNIVAGGQTSTIFSGNPGAMMNASNVLSISGGIHIAMAAASNATVTVAVSGSTKTIDVKQFYTLGTNFSGFLAC